MIMQTLNEYTKAAEKLIYSYQKRYRKSVISDELVGYVINAMAQSDLKVLDCTRSNMNRFSLRRQDGVYAIRRYIDNEKKRRKMFSLDEKKFTYQKKESQNYKSDPQFNEVFNYFCNHNNIEDVDKACVLLLLDGYKMQEIAKKTKKTLSRVTSSLEKCLAVYQQEKGVRYEDDNFNLDVFRSSL